MSAGGGTSHRRVGMATLGSRASRRVASPEPQRVEARSAHAGVGVFTDNSSTSRRHASLIDIHFIRSACTSLASFDGLKLIRSLRFDTSISTSISHGSSHCRYIFSYLVFCLGF